jgi:N-acetylglucosaminyl-diphospho-decaprenol L-rhamnosyltransferase
VAATGRTEAGGRGGGVTRRVTVIIVTFRSRDTVGAVLEALEPAFDEGWLACTVVDNDSGDGGPEYVAASFPWVELIQSGANLGFGRANNLGFENVQTPYVLFLNPDAVIRPDSVGRMLDFLDARPEAGILGPAMLNRGYPGQLVSKFPTPGSMIREALGRRPRAYFIGPDTPPFRIDWIGGAALLVRSELMRTLGGFDPRFFLYFEETDLCLRARLLGVQTWLLGTAVADHIGGASTSKALVAMHRGCIPDHFFRSRYYYMCKHYGRVAATLAEIAEMCILTARSLGPGGRAGGPREQLSARLSALVLRQPRQPPWAAFRGSRTSAAPL